MSVFMNTSMAQSIEKKFDNRTAKLDPKLVLFTQVLGGSVLSPNEMLFAFTILELLQNLIIIKDKFPDFKTALEFTNRVGEAADEEGHHPALLTEWGKVKVSWWTHAIAGLHRNDFIMAAKTDQIAIQSQKS